MKASGKKNGRKSRSRKKKTGENSLRTTGRMPGNPWTRMRKPGREDSRKSRREDSSRKSRREDSSRKNRKEDSSRRSRKEDGSRRN